MPASRSTAIGRPPGFDAAGLPRQVVIRILNTRATVLALDSLGFERDGRTPSSGARSKEGIVLVTGRTGSGKTDTHASLRLVQNEGVNT